MTVLLNQCLVLMLLVSVVSINLVDIKADFQPVLRSRRVCFHFCFEFIADITLR